MCGFMYEKMENERKSDKRRKKKKKRGAPVDILWMKSQKAKNGWTNEEWASRSTSSSGWEEVGGGTYTARGQRGVATAPRQPDVAFIGIDSGIPRKTKMATTWLVLSHTPSDVQGNKKKKTHMQMRRLIQELDHQCQLLLFDLSLIEQRKKANLYCHCWNCIPVSTMLGVGV